MLFPNKGVRLVSINDQFDTTDGMTNQNKDVPVQSSIHISLINLLNEQASVDIKKKVEVTLDMKVQHGEFIAPWPPFGCQKSCKNPNQLIPDPVAVMSLSTATKRRDSYKKQYATFQKLLSASSKDILLIEIMDYIDKIVVDRDRKIVVKWNIPW